MKHEYKTDSDLATYAVDKKQVFRINALGHTLTAERSTHALARQLAIKSALHDNGPRDEDFFTPRDTTATATHEE